MNVAAGAPRAPDYAGPPDWFIEVEDQYEYRGMIGTGGFAEVHRVWHRQWNLEMAVKSPKNEGYLNDDLRIRLEYFEREARTWCELVKHPNIITAFYVRKLDGLPRVFMEFAPKGTLRTWIEARWPEDKRREQTRKFPFYLDNVVLDIAIQICDGMSHALEQGKRHDLIGGQCAHRDLKPENILFNQDGLAQIGDFGLAWGWHTASRLANELPPTSLPNLEGTFNFGTPPYRSPEHGTVTGRDPRVDVWSFAILLWEMLTGTKPADGIQAREYIGTELSRVEDRQLPEELQEMLINECLAPFSDRLNSFVPLRERLLSVYQATVGEVYPRTSPPIARLQAPDLNNKALSQLDLGNEEAAKNCWQRSLEADPVYLPTVFNYGLFRWRKGSWTDIDFVESMEMLAQDALSSGYVHFLLAQIHVVRGDPERARSHLEQMPLGSVPDTELLSLRGLIEFNRGEFAAGRVAYAESLSQNQAQPKDLLGAACCCSRLGDKRGVERALEQLKKLRCTNTEIFLSEFDRSSDNVCHLIDEIEPFQIVFYADVSLPDTHIIPLRFVPMGDRVMVSGKFRSTYGGIGEIRLEKNPPEFSFLGELTESLWCLEILPDGRGLFGDNEGPPHHDHDGKLHLLNFRDFSSRKVLTDKGQNATRALSVSNDGELAVSVDITGHEARVWDLESGECIDRIPCEKGCHGAGFLRGKKIVIVVLNGKGELKYYQVGTGFIGGIVCVDVPERFGVPQTLHTSQDGRRILCVGNKGAATWWDLESGERLSSAPVGKYELRLGKSEEWVLGTGRRGLALASFSNGMVIHTLQPHSSTLSYDFSADMRWISADGGKGIRVWRVNGLRSSHLTPFLFYLLSEPQPAPVSIGLAETFELHLQDAYDALDKQQLHKALDAARAAQKVPGYERDSQILEVLHLLATNGRRIGVRNGWKALELTGHRMHLAHAAFHPDVGMPLAISSSWDGTFRIWNVENGLPVYTSPQLAAIVEAATFTLDERALVGAGGALLEYDLVKRKLTQIREQGEVLMLEDLEIQDVDVKWSFSRDGIFAARLGELGNLECWDTCKRLRLWEQQTPTRDWVVLHPREPLLLTGSEPMCLWYVPDGKFLGEYRLKASAPWQVCFSSDGLLLAVTGRDGSLTLWDWKTRRCIQQFESKLSYPVSMAFATDGQWLLTGSDNDMILWNTNRTRPALHLRSHLGQVTCVDLSPDGRRAISGAWGRELFLWEFDWEIDFWHGH